MAGNVDDLRKAVDRIDKDVMDVKKDVQGIINGQQLGTYKNDLLVKSLEKIELKLINIQEEVSVFRNELRNEINSTKEDMRRESYRNFITKDQYAPVKNVVYGLVALILVAVTTALLAIVIIKPTP